MQYYASSVTCYFNAAGGSLPNWCCPIRQLLYTGQISALHIGLYLCKHGLSSHMYTHVLYKYKNVIAIITPTHSSY